MSPRFWDAGSLYRTVQGRYDECGARRFGTDPAPSVLDPWCKAHQLDNLSAVDSLYAVDSSFFVSASAVTLTIVAHALRVATHLRDLLG